MKLSELPPLLSPTLPPRIEAELAKLQALESSMKKTSQKNTLERPLGLSGKKLPKEPPPNAKDVTRPVKKPISDMDSKVSESKPSTVKLNAKKAGPHRGLQLEGHHDVSSSQSTQPLKTNGGTGAKLLSNGLGSKTKGVPASAGKSKSALGTAEKLSYLVKLKIPKSVRNRLAALLRLPGSRKPEVSRHEQVVAPTEKSKVKAINTILKTQIHSELIHTPPSKPAQNLQEKGPQGPGTKDKLNHLERAPKRRLVDEAINLGSSNKRHKSSEVLLAPKQPNAASRVTAESTTHLQHKRRLLEDSGDSTSSSKRQKLFTAIGPPEKPHTPARPAAKSPATSLQGSAKSQISTPKRDLKPVAMRRVLSGDGDVQTPLGGVRGGTPVAPSSAEGANREGSSLNTSVSHPTNGRKEEIAAWKEEQTKHLDLGRTLKHDADAILQPITGEPDFKGLAIAVETVLCYMIGFTAGDEAQRLSRKPCDGSSWRSLLGYLHFVKGRTHDVSPLNGLCLQLEAVCRHTILLHELERVEREIGLPPGLDDAPRSNASAAVAAAATATATAHPTEPAARHAPPPRRDESREFKTKMLENARLAQQLWVSGSLKLSLHELQRSFPTTWAKGTMAPPAEGTRERLVAKKYGGSFYLPLGPATNGIEAVRMAWSLLEEWCAKEGVEWEEKIGLSSMEV